MVLELEMDTFSRYPGLPPPDEMALRETVVRVTGLKVVSAVSYGTEAGLFHGAILVFEKGIS